ncbi:MAG: hypothetical protein QXR27_06575 [Archaeoglobaceae archaeon]
MTNTMEFILLILLTISIILNIVQLRKIKILDRELKDVDARVSVTKRELAQSRKRLEKMKSEMR